MIDINKLKELVQNDKRVLVTEHAAARLRIRGIRYADIISCIISGEIVEMYPEDHPYPSCLILGVTVKGEKIHVVCGSDNEYIWIITAYYPSEDKWLDDFKTRR